MNSMKLAFKKVRDYLGRDAHGIGLLQKAESLSDELRKENAKLREEAESAKKKAEDATARQVTCEQQLREEKDLRQASDARLQQASVTIERLEREIRPAPPPDSSEPLNTEGAVRRQVKTLKHAGFKWPFRYFISSVQETHVDLNLKMPGECYDVADIIKNWSGSELLKLGRFIALETVAMHGYFTVLYSSKKVFEKSDSTNRALIGLLENCTTLTQDEAEKARLVGSKAEPPKSKWVDRAI